MLDTREHLKLDLVVETLRCRGTTNLRAWGVSMLPAVWPGDLLTIQSASSGEIVLGDIVLVLQDHRFFIHRLVAKQLDQGVASWITKGDAVRHNDPVTMDLLGRVIEIRRGKHTWYPARSVSRFHSAIAWMLCHSSQLRNLALRIYKARQKSESTRGEHLHSDALYAEHAERATSLSHTFPS